jgi:serine O-acetyltransferase
VIFYRIQEFLRSKKLHFLSNLISNLNQTLTGAEFVPGCFIGDSFVVRHPSGIVIGRGVIIGNNCTILQGVTIGEKYIDGNANGMYPEIGDDVSIGTGAIIVGEIKVGSNSTIGALSFVNQSVPSNSTAIGIPARFRSKFLE